VSRGLLDRARAAGEDDPLAGVIVVARLDVAAQRHALVEGAPDPYPGPDEYREPDGGSDRMTTGGSPPPRIRRPPGGGRMTPAETARREQARVSYDAGSYVIQNRRKESTTEESV
jgi:hypothetical protein